MLRCPYCDLVLRTLEHRDNLTIVQCPKFPEGPIHSEAIMGHEAITLFDPEKAIAKKYS